MSLGAVRVLDVENLGWGSALVEIQDQTVLLVDAAMSLDDRIEVMNDLMADRY